MTEAEAADIRKMSQTVKQGLLDYAAQSEAAAAAGELAVQDIRKESMRLLQMPKDPAHETTFSEFAAYQMDIATRIEAYNAALRLHTAGARFLSASLPEQTQKEG